MRFFTLLNKKIPNWRVQRLALFFARGHKISNMGKMNSKNLLVVKLSKKNYHFNLYPDKNFTKVKSTISGLNRKCVGGPKNNTHFWSQRVRSRRYWFQKIPISAFKGMKPIISGLKRKCVGGPKNNIHYWSQRVRLRRYWF